jgi:hypothetical protein
MDFNARAKSIPTIEFPTVESQTREIERILLRYNKETKALFKKYSDLAIQRRQDCVDENLSLSETDRFTDKWPEMEKIIFVARGLQVIG